MSRSPPSPLPLAPCALVSLLGCRIPTWETGDTAVSATTTDSDLGADSGDTAEARAKPTAPIVVYTTRHCEKDDGDDPGLTEEGQARAEALAVLLTDAPLVATYASELRRTQETVQPTADDHGLDVQTDLDPEEELALHILLTHSGEALLHAGHSYTLATFMETLGVTELPDGFDYGDLWTITIDTDGVATWEESYYGEPEDTGG